MQLRLRALLRTLALTTCVSLTTAAGANANPPVVTNPSLALPALVSLGSGADIAVPEYGQQTAAWCWAAASLMTIKYFRPSSTLRECDLANQRFGLTNCCTSPVPGPCVVGGYEMLSSNGFTFDTTPPGVALSFDELRHQISGRRTPVQYSQRWNNGGSHELVVAGWFQLAGLQFVHINDPSPPSSSTSPGGARESQTYAWWAGGPSPTSDHRHKADWYNIIDSTNRTAPFVLPTVPVALPAGIPHFSGDPVERIAIDPRVTERASSMLESMRHASPALARALGLGREGAASAELGTPMREFTAGLDALRAYRRGAAATTVLSGGDIYFYPVLANGTIRSSIRISASAGADPKVIGIGEVATAARLSRLGDVAAAAHTNAVSNLVSVRVPAFNLYFVARTAGGRLELESAVDAPSFGITAGRYEDARAVFARIAQVAQQMRSDLDV